MEVSRSGHDGMTMLANQITAHNAGWRIHFRFAGHGFWSGVCGSLDHMTTTRKYTKCWLIWLATLVVAVTLGFLQHWSALSCWILASVLSALVFGWILSIVHRRFARSIASLPPEERERRLASMTPRQRESVLQWMRDYVG